MKLKRHDPTCGQHFYWWECDCCDCDEQERWQMSEREEWMSLIRNEYDPAPSHYRMGDNWDDGAGRIADAILADKTLLLRKHAEELEEAGKAAMAIRNELDRMRAERASWEAQFHSAAAAASEYSEFWERHHGDFDQFGNYLPYSQIDGDLRAAKAEIERLRTAPPRSLTEEQRDA